MLPLTTGPGTAEEAPSKDEVTEPASPPPTTHTDEERAGLDTAIEPQNTEPQPVHTPGVVIAMAGAAARNARTGAPAVGVALATGPPESTPSLTGAGTGDDSVADQSPLPRRDLVLLFVITLLVALVTFSVILWLDHHG